MSLCDATALIVIVDETKNRTLLPYALRNGRIMPSDTLVEEYVM